MTSRRKSALAAVAMFLLIAAVVLGGMTWATLASFELAKKTVSEEHLTRVSRALGRIDSAVLGVLNSEASRRYTDYVDYHSVVPDSVVTLDGREQEAMWARLRSSLALDATGAEKPLFEWIELYFQIDHLGRLSTPQFDRERIRTGALASAPLDPPQRRALETWEWFRRVQHSIDFKARVTDALVRDDSSTGGSEPETTLVLRVPRSLRGGRYNRTFSGNKERYLPPELCLDPRIAAENIRDLPVAIDSGFDESTTPPGLVRISYGAFAPPFWVDAPGSREKKLAFVRECHADAEVIYQGFVGDWGRLKGDLLHSVDDLFPEADLEPVPNDVELTDEAESVKLRELPALLRVPDIEGGTVEAAWRSIRGVLLISWTAALAVLITAGWGVWNLVALTERRLQFAYAVTHELRTPLTTFQLYSDMLSAGLVPESSKQEYMDTLNRESQRLSSLVEAVLEYARLENQKVRLHLSDTNAGSLLQVLAETIQTRCRKNAIEGRTACAVPEAHPVRTDVNLVNQITAVLVDNACRHARNSKSPSVAVQLGTDNGRLFVDVVDSGPGVELTDARQIFKPFRRGRDADASARGGIGLGLALARNWADLLGGRLELVARHDPQLGGAHFRLTIPSQQSM